MKPRLSLALRAARAVAFCAGVVLVAFGAPGCSSTETKGEESAAAKSDVKPAEDATPKKAESTTTTKVEVKEAPKDEVQVDVEAKAKGKEPQPEESDKPAAAESSSSRSNPFSEEQVEKLEKNLKHLESVPVKEPKSP